MLAMPFATSQLSILGLTRAGVTPEIVVQLSTRSIA